jgi:CTP synthase (UTP-ammonia lyase)
MSCSPFFSVSLETFLCAGDIESMPFTEALGQFSYRVGKTTTYETLHDTV